MTVRPYQPADRQALESLMIELQQHIAALDPYRRNRTPEDFNVVSYIDQLMKQVERNHGLILIISDENAVAGFVAGSIPDEDPSDLLDHYPSQEGKIIELVVSEAYRGKGVGRALMEKMEEYLREKGCEYIRVGVFSPNADARGFYEKCGYDDRYTEMIKKL